MLANRVSQLLKEFLKDTTIRFCGAAIAHDVCMLSPYGIEIPFAYDLQKIVRNPMIRLKCIYNFLCSMLVYTSFALCFVYTLWCSYAFSGTNLLTRCHSASSCFLLFLCFRKVTQEIFLKLDETKAEVPNYLTQRQSPKESRRRTKEQPHLVVARATPRSRHQGV
jgi:hypothetical protein